jgi:hypothetical protein
MQGLIGAWKSIAKERLAFPEHSTAQEGLLGEWKCTAQERRFDDSIGTGKASR